MPKELPGFYYDAEKNRYFPIKGPIPGSSRSSSSSSTSAQKPLAKPPPERNLSKRKRLRTSKLLQARELNGNIITSSKGKYNFMEEFQKRLASQPTAWKYRATEMSADSALEQIKMAVQTPAGETEMDILLTGSANGNLSYFEVGKVWQDFDYGVKSIPDCEWPHLNENKVVTVEVPGYIWRPPGPSFQMKSGISCIKSFGYNFSCMSEDSKTMHSLVTTLGSETYGGSVYILNLVEPLDSDNNIPTLRQRMYKVFSSQCTVWTADYNPRTNQAVIGTNLGAALVNLETGAAPWVCRSKSDVLSLQLDHSGKVVLCGLRNGAIVTVDVREKQEHSSSRLIQHRIPYSHSGQTGRNSKQWFQLKGNIDPSHTIRMPSSISCLVSLGLHDQYFLASSMDGSVKLYDHRLSKRGAVQTYEGHVNSHTRIQLGVDPSERFVVSGGEDYNLRLWSIKSGELLFEDKFSNSVLSTVYWEKAAGFVGMQDERQSHDDSLFKDNCSWKAWLGSREGLFHMHWS